MTRNAFGLTKTRLLFGISAMVAIVSIACGAGSAKQTPVYTPHYNYNPTGTGGGQASIALLKADWFSNGASVTRLLNPTGKTFLGALDSAIQRGLNANGFKIAGPYVSIEEMTFPQKKQVDLVMRIVVNVETTTDPSGKTDISSWDGSETFHGACLLGGNIAVEAWEPLSSQKMWSKEIPMPDVKQDCSGDSAAVENGKTRLLEKAFTETMKKLELYFSPEEIELVRKQSQDLRDKKVY